MNDDAIPIKYDFRCTGIFVIQSLPENDDATGDELFKDIIKGYSDRAGFYSQYREAYDRSEFLQLLDSVVDAVLQKRHFPILHFEIHGSTNGTGFVLASGELVTWTEFAKYCRKINVFLKNELIISLSTCHGAQLYQSIDFDKPAPFWGFIAPKGSILNKRLLEDYTKFYEYFLSEKDLSSAVATIDLFSEDCPYKIIIAEMIFDEYWDIGKKMSLTVPIMTRHEKRAAMRNLNNPLSGDLFWKNKRRKFLMK